MYTSLKISKLIQERVPEVIPAKKEHNVIGEDTYLYTLADVIRAIKVYRTIDNLPSDALACSQVLIRHYLPTLSLQSDEVETVLISIFK